MQFDDEIYNEKATFYDSKGVYFPVSLYEENYITHNFAKFDILEAKQPYYQISFGLQKAIYDDRYLQLDEDKQ